MRAGGHAQEPDDMKQRSQPGALVVKRTCHPQPPPLSLRRPEDQRSGAAVGV